MLCCATQISFGSLQLVLPTAFGHCLLEESSCFYLCPLIRGSPHVMAGQYRNAKAQPPCLDWEQFWGMVSLREIQGFRTSSEASFPMTSWFNFSLCPVLLSSLALLFLRTFSSKPCAVSLQLRSCFSWKLTYKS